MLRFSLLRYFLWGLLLAILLPASSALAQKNLSYYLSLQGQARLDSLAVRGVRYWDEMDSLTTFREFDAIRKYAAQNDDPILGFYASYLSGLLLNYKSRGVKAQQRYEYLLKIRQELQKQSPNSFTERLRADIEYQLGENLYFIRSEPQKTLDHYLKADLYYRKIGYENVLFADYRLAHIGYYYYDSAADYETALRYLNEAEKYAKKDPIDSHRIFLYRTKAKCLVALKKYKEAIRYNELGIAQVRLSKDSLKVGGLSGNIGEIILNYTNKPASAEPYFQKELTIRLKYKPKGVEDIAKAYGNLCQVAGVNRQAEAVKMYFDKAITYINQSNDDNDFPYVIKSIYYNRMVADSLLGDYQSAFHYQTLYHRYVHLTNSLNVKVVTSQATVKFEAERFKLEAELADQQNKVSQFWVIIISLALVIALAGAYGVYRYQRNKESKIAQQLAFEQKEAERLAELDGLKNRFFANISHEFRTPLTLILSPLQDILKTTPNDPTFKSMKQNAERLLSLINQLLELSKLEGGNVSANPMPTNVVQFFRYLFSSFESLAQNRQILFQYEQSHEHWPGLIDTDKVEKITTNLLSNAFKFTPDHGRIQVRVNYTEGQIQLKVQDFGIGIASQQLPHIFDRFYQADNQDNRHYEGTGIGLALVKELVNVLKGSISVESQLNQGTTFVVTLPCPSPEATSLLHYEEPLSALALTPQTSTEAPSHSARDASESSEGLLLLVEDNQDLRSYIRKQFEQSYRVVEAKDGQEGIERAIELVPDLVICDLMMPRLDGLSFCKLLKSNEITSHIPVIMLTAKASLENRLEGLELGADDYLAKPFDSAELQVRVRNLIQIRQNLRNKYDGWQPKASSAPASELTLEDTFLQKINLIIEKNITDATFDVEALAEPMHISAVQLRRKLKALTGQTAIEYIRNYRLNRAAEMLKNKQGNVSEIAYSVGFESLSYFSRSFQERFGQKPSDW